MKLDWLTGEADEALNKLESAPFDPDPDKQRAHLTRCTKSFAMTLRRNTAKWHKAPT